MTSEYECVSDSLLSRFNNAVLIMYTSLGRENDFCHDIVLISLKCLYFIIMVNIHVIPALYETC
jgi:hypothetical protein